MGQEKGQVEACIAVVGRLAVEDDEPRAAEQHVLRAEIPVDEAFARGGETRNLGLDQPAVNGMLCGHGEKKRIEAELMKVFPRIEQDLQIAAPRGFAVDPPKQRPGGGRIFHPGVARQQARFPVGPPLPEPLHGEIAFALRQHAGHGPRTSLPHGLEVEPLETVAPRVGMPIGPHQQFGQRALDDKNLRPVLHPVDFTRDPAGQRQQTRCRRGNNAIAPQQVEKLLTHGRSRRILTPA